MIGASLETLGLAVGVRPDPKGESSVADGESVSDTAVHKLCDLKQLLNLSESQSHLSQQRDLEDKMR